MASPEAQLAIFDLDGTLIDSRADIATAANAARAALSLPPLPAERIVAFVGDGAAKLVERLTPGMDSDQRRLAMNAFLAAYDACCCDRTRPFPGIPAVLERLRAAGWRTAVATNKPLGFTTRILAACGLAASIDSVRGGDGPRKPDPGQLLDLIAEAGVAPVRTWMVGDHHTDLQAARAAGCRSLFCTWGFGSRGELVADAEAGSPEEVVEILLG